MRRNVSMVVLASLVFAGCADTVHGKSVAEPQVAVAHARMNDKQFEEIYATAGDEFRKAAPKEKVIALFSAINRKLGSPKSSKTMNWNVRTFNFKTIVMLVEDTEFAQGKGTETFTFLVSGQKAELIGYNINSLDMLIK
jgi:hypothetical protein